MQIGWNNREGNLLPLTLSNVLLVNIQSSLAVLTKRIVPLSCVPAVTGTALLPHILISWYPDRTSVNICLKNLNKQVHPVLFV